MKKIAVLSVSAIACLALSSFKSIKNETKAETPVKYQHWVSVCGDGTTGGAFYCDCTQSQANQIAHVMCQ